MWFCALGICECLLSALSPTDSSTDRNTHKYKKNIDSGGEGGIRTPDRSVSPYNGLANRRLQPLGHLSGGYAASSIVSVSGLIGSLRRFLRSALLLSFVLAFFRHVVRDRDLLIQLCWPDFQNEGNAHHEFKGDHALAAFDAADILPVKIAQLSQPLLREVAASPQLLQLFAEQNQGAGHAVRVLRQASNVKPHAGLRPVWCYTILLPTWLRLYQRFGTSLVLLRTTAFIPADTPTQVSAMP